MRLFISPRIAHLVAKVKWLGRACIVVLKLSSSMPSSPSAVLLVLHGAHGPDAFQDALGDCSTFLSTRPSNCRALAYGDWNADLLPTLQLDPWAERPGRREIGVELRLALQSWVAASGLELALPEVSNGIPRDARWDCACHVVPISRIPGREQGQMSALLHFGAPSRSFVNTSFLSWGPRIGDHAFVGFVVVRSKARPAFQKAR
jgi:hypothetical protein